MNLGKNFSRFLGKLLSTLVKLNGESKIFVKKAIGGGFGGTMGGWYGGIIGEDDEI